MDKLIKESENKPDKDIDSIEPIMRPLMIAAMDFLGALKDTKHKDIFIMSLYASLIGNRAKDIDEMLHLNKFYQKAFIHFVKDADKTINK